ncbi:hypothetical protein C0995_004892 [Termitomyces sp. Mi166|nr:hypothetical protein C0995_004892 [Termitomyces sp. Mi166\
MVHSALQMPEIVAIICETVCITHNGGLDHHRTLATLAKVSRTFRFWALKLEKHIWTDLNSPLPLLMSLPRDLWTINLEDREDPVLVFKRPPTGPEIEDFAARSSRVIRLTLPIRAVAWKDEPPCKAEFLRVAPEACTMLHDAALTAGRVLFPNLISITVLDPSPGLEPLYRDFGPNLVEVNIDLNLHKEANGICETFLQHLSRQNPGIRSLKIDFTPEHILRNTVCALPQLERLETRSFPTAQGLQHLGSLATLKTLTFQLGPSTHLSQWLTPLKFASVQHLTCECDNIDDAILFLSNISHCRLIHLGITFRDEEENGVPQVRQQKWTELARAIISHAGNRSSLTSLRIEECQKYGWYSDASPLEFDSVVTPLLELKNLCELEINSDSGMSVDERDYDILACSMPLLKRVNIRTPPPIDGSSVSPW